MDGIVSSKRPWPSDATSRPRLGHLATLHGPRMGPRRRTRPAVALLAAALALGLAAAVALAGGDRLQEQLLEQGRGQGAPPLERQALRQEMEGEGQERARASATGARGACGYRPPVEGDTDGPDHDFRAKEKLLKATPKGFGEAPTWRSPCARARARATSSASSPRGTGSSSCARRRAAEAGFPAKGRSQAIKGVGKPNVAAPEGGRRQGHGEGERDAARQGDRLRTRARSTGASWRSAVGSTQALRKGRSSRPSTTSSSWSRTPSSPDELTETLERPRTGGPGLGPRRQLAGDRPQRRSQHLRPRRQDARAGDPRGDGRRGLPVRRPIHSSGRAIVWRGPREPAEHYWEQLQDAGLTMAPLEQH